MPLCKEGCSQQRIKALSSSERIKYSLLNVLLAASHVFLVIGKSFKDSTSFAFGNPGGFRSHLAMAGVRSISAALSVERC